MHLKEDFKGKLQVFCNFLIFFYYYKITGLQGEDIDADWCYYISKID
jgi:hypothetical protein